MMGQQTSDQSQLFYLFNLEGRIPAGLLAEHAKAQRTKGHHVSEDGTN